MIEERARAFCPRCEDLLREDRCRGCCERCETPLLDGACPRCPLPDPSLAAPNLLHEIGELLELRPATSIAQVNAFLSESWLLLRVADASCTFLLGWRRTQGTTRYPEWYEAEQREREALLEALRVSETEAPLTLE